MAVIDIVRVRLDLPWFWTRLSFDALCAVCVIISFCVRLFSIAVSLSLSSSFVLMFNEANILLWQTVVFVFMLTANEAAAIEHGVRSSRRS